MAIGIAKESKSGKRRFLIERGLEQVSSSSGMALFRCFSVLSQRKVKNKVIGYCVLFLFCGVPFN